MINFKNIIEFTDNLSKLKKDSGNYFSTFCSNKTANKTTKFFSENYLILTSHTPLVLDDDSIYSNFYKILQELQDNYTLSDLATCVQRTIFGYFGSGMTQDDFRNYIYLNNWRNDKNTSIKDFKCLGISQCLERASVAHNLFKLLGLKSALISSDVYINNKQSLHCYNIIEYENQTYLVDFNRTSLNPAILPQPIIEKLDINSLSNSPFDDNKTFTITKPIVVSYVTKNNKSYTVEYIDNTLSNIDENANQQI